LPASTFWASLSTLTADGIITAGQSQTDHLFVSTPFKGTLHDIWF
jgi:hypothetical protein